MKNIFFILILAIILPACNFSNVNPNSGNVEINAVISPLCSEEIIDVEAPCGLSVNELNLIYGSYTLEIFNEKDVQLLSIPLLYSKNIRQNLPSGNYFIELSNLESSFFTYEPKEFTVVRNEQKVINIQIDTSIK